MEICGRNSFFLSDIKMEKEKMYKDADFNGREKAGEKIGK